MAGDLKERVGKALARLGLPYQDVSDPDDSDSAAAFFSEVLDEHGGPMQLVVTVSRGDRDVWVQGGVPPRGVMDRSAEWRSTAVANYDVSLRSAPNSLFSDHKLPKFRARGFQARVSWNSRQQKIVSTVVIPAREFSSAALGGTLSLVAHLAVAATEELERARQTEDERAQGTKGEATR